MATNDILISCLGIPNKPYQVVYADPPWRYNFSKSKSRRIENQYPTMDIEDIKKLRVPTADNAILFLWGTAPKLPEALSVMEAWGFKYLSNFVWDKVWIGMGFYFRGRHEYILVGTKGNIQTNEDIEQGICYAEKRTIHSKKPDFFRNKIAEWYPTQLKIELFSRGYYENWEVWGNEV